MQNQGKVVELLTGIFATFAATNKKYQPMKYVFTIMIMSVLITDAAAQHTTLIFDSFNDNSNNWGVEDNASAKTSVSGSHYYFENRTSSQYLSWKTLPLGFETNFEVWTVADHRAGVKDFGYGVLFGGSDASNCFEFIISFDGHFKVGYFNYGTWTTIQDWTFSSAINTTAGSTNDVGVISQYGTWHFMVGLTEVSSTPARALYGYNFGMAVENYQTIGFDDFEVIKGIYVEPIGDVVEDWSDPADEAEAEEWTEEDEAWLEALLTEDAEGENDKQHPDPNTLPVNSALMVPSDFAGRLNLIACDYPNNFANVRGEKKPSEEFDLIDSYYSLVTMDGLDEVSFSPGFASNNLSFHASFSSTNKSEAMRFYDTIKLKLLDASIDCTGLVYDERIADDPESAIPYSTYWLPFNLDETAATDFADFYMELEFLKFFQIDDDFNMTDEWTVTLRIGKL